MKKFVSVVMVLAMMLTLLAGCGGNADTPATTEAPAAEVPATAVEILEKVWAEYGDDEKFPIIGGNIEAGVMDAPANYDMAYAENMTFNLLIPAEQIANVSAILQNIEESPELKTMWDRYRKQFAYAADIEYSQIMTVLKTLME